MRQAQPGPPSPGICAEEEATIAALEAALAEMTEQARLALMNEGQWRENAMQRLARAEAAEAELTTLRGAVREYVAEQGPCEHERGHCTAHGTQRLLCDVAELDAALHPQGGTP